MYVDVRKCRLGELSKNMKSWRELAFPIVLFLCLLVQSGRCCTSFCLYNAGNPLFGTNFDNDKVYEGLLFVNKRNVSKSGWETGTTGEVTQWISKYGSVTFNLAGYQFAWAGMNEAGLVVSTMALQGTESEPPDERPPLLSSVWLQYLLDTCSSLEEITATQARVRVIENVDHFLVCDAKGSCAVIEFLGGKMVCHTGKTLPVAALTNNTYEESIDAWKKESQRGFLGKLFSKPERNPSLLRFKIAANRVHKFDSEKSEPAVKYALATLEMASGQKVRGSPTHWSIVFDVQNQRIYFRTSVNPQVRFFDFKAFDLSCKKPKKMLDIHAKLSGDIAGHFMEYSREADLSHFYRFCQKYGVDVTYEQLDKLTKRFESFECLE